MTSPRVRKVADRIQVIVAELLERRIKDPRLGFVTVTDVRLTGDTQQATVYYTVLGEDADQEATAAALASARGMIRSEVSRQLGMRHAPTVDFEYDGVPANARHVDEVLARAKESDAAVAAAREGKAPAGEADPYRKPREDDEAVSDEAVSDEDG
ncbi:30S ribosome-binding factor RbfA [Nocardioides panacisoli]|uniref:30S ribosome-binding factor RbfA n=1 Tax=Nocardioides panacisoli TaxID=627624 RepID=UPI001C6255C2|nr:30S ribosome-binding factor RbfA [Nocardioides panacisoli]QYJ05549.1 30S ribosome-binding factor RbfA [Nocardioides panacisoli]